MSQIQVAHRSATRTLRALLVPTAGQVRVVDVADCAAAIATTIKAACLDDSTTGVLPDGSRFAIYVADPSDGLPANPRAGVLAARLGMEDRAVMAALRGDILVTGLAPRSEDDRDVPAGIVTLAERHLHP